MRLSVIIPVHNGAATLNACLTALAASARPPDEVIVADDSSTDGSAQIAVGHGARLISLPGGPCGPAAARNRATEAATGDTLVFLDADVAVHTDTLGRMEAYLTEQPGVAALFGSYDDAPPAPGLVTRYKNLLHHYVHQNGKREAETFWAGCAAVRRSVFLEAGGFDETYEKPSIEDVELGGRLRRSGHSIRLCPEIQGTHLKRWTFRSWLRTDIFCRAVPWTHLILRNASLPSTLNLDWQSRAGALCAWSVVLFLLLLVATPKAGLGVLASLAALAALNAGLLRFFLKRGGTGFMVSAAGLHLLYLLYSSLTYVLIAGPVKLARYGLVLLLMATLFKGLAWSVIIPPWQAYDEPQHFLYGQSVERKATLYVPPDLLLPEELWDSAQLAQLDTVRFHPEVPVDLSDRRRVAAALSEMARPPAKRTYRADPARQVLTQANFYRYHPPLYYTLLAAVQKPLEDRSIAVRLLACRWVSLLLGLGTVGLAFALGAALWPGQPGRALLLGTLVSFQPLLTFTMSTATNGALEVLLFSAVLLVCVRVIKDRLDTRRALALGLLTGLGLLAKMSFLSVLPLLGLLLLWDVARLRHERRPAPRSLLLWGGAALLPLVLSGWWYHETILSGGDALVTTYGKIKAHAHFSLLGYLTTSPWGSVYSRVLASYWGAFGSVGDTPLPRVLQTCLIALSGLACFTLIRRLVMQRRTPDPNLRKRLFSVFFLGCSTLGIVLFYLAIDYRIARQLGGHFGLRGQYYLPPILGQMVWLVLGMELSLPQRFRSIMLRLFSAGMVLVNFEALFGCILPRYYGAGSLGEQLGRASILQPVGQPAVFVLSVLFVVSALLLTAALFAGPPALDEAHSSYQEAPRPVRCPAGWV